MAITTTQKNNLVITILVILNIIDVFLHVATNQVELLRITGNIVILLMVLALFLNLVKTRYQLVAIAVLVYFILNFLFISISQSIGLPGVIFIGLTTGMGAYLAWEFKKVK